MWGAFAYYMAYIYEYGKLWLFRIVYTFIYKIYYIYDYTEYSIQL